MASVASGGAMDRIAARTRFNVLRAGSGTRARYSSTSFGGRLRFAGKPRARELAFFIDTLQHSRLESTNQQWVSRSGANSYRVSTAAALVKWRDGRPPPPSTN